MLRPKTGKYLDVYVDADFNGNWDKDKSLDRGTARSNHSYIIMYAGFPLLWKSQFQNGITLSSTES